MSMYLRPHHGMCFQFYEGKGYSEDFTDHIGRVIRECEASPERKVTLVCRTDDVCSSCPNNMNGVCDSEDKVMRYDRAVLEACCLSDGIEISYSEFIDAVRTQVIESGIRKKICGDCSWDYICSKKDCSMMS